MVDGELIGGGSVAVVGALRLDSMGIGVDTSLLSEMVSFEPHAAVAMAEQHSTTRAIWRLTATRIDLQTYSWSSTRHRVAQNDPWCRGRAAPPCSTHPPAFPPVESALPTTRAAQSGVHIHYGPAPRAAERPGLSRPGPVRRTSQVCRLLSAVRALERRTRRPRSDHRSRGFPTARRLQRAHLACRSSPRDPMTRTPRRLHAQRAAPRSPVRMSE